jgi:hypothetical protein
MVTTCDGFTLKQRIHIADHIIPKIYSRIKSPQSIMLCSRERIIVSVSLGSDSCLSLNTSQWNNNCVKREVSLLGSSVNVVIFLINLAPLEAISSSVLGSVASLEKKSIWIWKKIPVQNRVVKMPSTSDNFFSCLSINTSIYPHTQRHKQIVCETNKRETVS